MLGWRFGAVLFVIVPLAACRFELFPSDEPSAKRPDTKVPASPDDDDDDADDDDDGSSPPDASLPAKDPAVKRLYYGACLSELAFSDAKRILRFYAETTSTSTKLTMRLKAFPVDLAAHPASSFESAATVGAATEASSKLIDKAFVLDFGTLSLPATANPISSSPMVIESAVLRGRFAAKTFCARVAGDVTAPAAAARELDPSLNICQFVALEEGDTIPTFSASAFQATSCPAE